MAHRTTQSHVATAGVAAILVAAGATARAARGRKQHGAVALPDSEALRLFREARALRAALRGYN